MNQKKTAIILSFIVGLTFGVPVAMAQTATNAAVRLGATAAGANINVQAQISLRVSKADQEIARRITALNALNTRVQAMEKVSAGEKSTISSEVQTEINDLTALKAKLDADTDLATFRADAKSIVTSYRIFLLVLPQNYILAAADRVSTIVDAMNGIGAKMQTRITAAQSAGKDVSAMASAQADFSAKVGDASVQSQAAANLVASLTPDQGDQAKAAANHAALLKARADIKTATQDLQAARKDMVTILQGLKVSSTAGVQQGKLSS